MNSTTPRVSVVIPTYNRKKEYLLRAINSVKNQTYKNTEIIVIDDNDPDSEFRNSTKKFMEQYTNNLNIVYYMNEKNIGGSLSRNKGINLAQGDYITFLDDDDEYLQNKLEKQVSFMVYKNCDMSFTNLKIVNEKKVVLDYRRYPNFNSSDKHSVLKYHLMRHLTGTPTFMYKSDKLKEIGGFEDVKMGQEFYLMLKSIEKNLNICYLDDCDVIAYRHNDGGISQGRNKIIGENALYDFKKKYFDIFSVRERMFIRFRHYAVLTVAYKRNKEYIKSLGSAIAMFLSSPIDLVNEINRYVINVVKVKGLIVQKEGEKET